MPTSEAVIDVQAMAVQLPNSDRRKKRLPLSALAGALLAGAGLGGRAGFGGAAGAAAGVGAGLGAFDMIACNTPGPSRRTDGRLVHVNFLARVPRLSTLFADV